MIRSVARILVAAAVAWILIGAPAQALDDRGVVLPLEPVSTAAVGNQHSCAVVLGKVYCWGYNLYGQLGDGGDTERVDPMPVDLPVAIEKVAGGASHTCALGAGRVWCWGNNDYGQLGNGGLAVSLLPVEVTGLGGAASQISLGDYHSCALVAGNALCWGLNVFGQLGDDTYDDRLVPTPIALPLPPGSVSDIVAGVMHTCARVQDAAWCWGNNASGQLGLGTSGNSVAGPNMVIGLQGQTVLEVVAGAAHSCARLAGGGVYCWGENYYGQLGNDSTVNTSAPVAVVGLGGAASALGAGYTNSCAVVAGRVRCWGGNSYWQLGDPALEGSTTPVEIPGLSGVQRIIVRAFHLCAQPADASLRCWGNNRHGELGDGAARIRTAPVDTLPAGSGVGALGLGFLHSCAGLPGGLRCWGYSGLGAVGLGQFTVTEPWPVPVAGISSMPSSVAGGEDHSCAAYNGDVLCWGFNEKGQLGVGDQQPRAAPAYVLGLPAGATQVATGSRHSCAIVAGGVWCWGYGANGELGNGAAEDSLLPVPVSGLSGGVSAISAGYNHTCAVQSGVAKCWGLNTDGQIGNNVNAGIQTTPVAAIGLSVGVTAISAGVTHTCAVADGAAWCWGYDGYGQLGNGIRNDASFVPAPVTGMGSGVVSIAAGDDISCAVRGHSLYCWGADYDGDLGNGAPARSLRLLASPVIGFSNNAAGPVAIGGTHVCAATVSGGLRCWGDDFAGSLGIGREIVGAVPRPVVKQDVLFANGLD